VSYIDTVARDGFSSRMRAAFVERRSTCSVLFFYAESLLRLIGGNLPKREAHLLESEADRSFSDAQPIEFSPASAVNDGLSGCLEIFA
jgi:hypothetical protein